MKCKKKYLIRVFLPIVFACSMAYQTSHATPLSLGSVNTVTSVPNCPAGAATGAKCMHMNVTGCPIVGGGTLADQGVTIALTTVKSPKGTIVLQDGGGGTSFFSTAGFPDYYVSQGYNVVQTAWDAGSDGHGWQTGNNGVLSQACRPATLFQYIYNNTTAHPSGKAFCGQGISGGGGTFAYALAHYANNISGHTTQTQQYLFDYVLITSGPAVSRLDVGCAPSQVYNNQPITTCTTTSSANSSVGNPPYYGFVYQSNPVDAWENTNDCGYSNPSSGDITIWRRDSILSNGSLGHTGVFTYGQTNVSFYFCNNSNNNQSLGLGWFLTQAIKPKNGTGSNNLAPVYCANPTFCTGEAVWSDPAAVTQAKSDMATYCVLNPHT